MKQSTRIILIIFLIGVLSFILYGGVHRYFPFIWKYDKLGHCFLYFSANFFTYLILFFPNGKHLRRTSEIVFILGFLEEVRQGLTPRGFSCLDILANFVGILLSILLIKLLYNVYENRKNREKSISY